MHAVNVHMRKDDRKFRSLLWHLPVLFPSFELLLLSHQTQRLNPKSCSAPCRSALLWLRLNGVWVIYSALDVESGRSRRSYCVGSCGCSLVHLTLCGSEQLLTALWGAEEHCFPPRCPVSFSSRTEENFSRTQLFLTHWLYKMWKLNSSTTSALWTNWS